LEIITRGSVPHRAEDSIFCRAGPEYRKNNKYKNASLPRVRKMDKKNPHSTALERFGTNESEKTP
jgi:hypothetical protein